ncbi:hypothetical protein SERLA73DRAFT_176942 [Serpula lacrymans var. lacrymans S7.3]|uniref:Uncharacterized protein n=2 Tax=Serpula lacrymans var. lacrymans TaxID=341189 RepID=F8PQG2_SERL3|nr:uncharacterized protein SERLADRAFT_460277 [Serpula lacrymans var. lacrymans S7.9]EGO01575.1 hypothetical protein SERLA73DRAFT_176942 [Serpula lacrymans var. lacrymans S7.3]EGO27233.1 hypothetical protein SERLADRAFT_460277 [Serpula lacrymans var. lacrymans S7.9]
MARIYLCSRIPSCHFVIPQAPAMHPVAEDALGPLPIVLPRLRPSRLRGPRPPSTPGGSDDFDSSLSLYNSKASLSRSLSMASTLSSEKSYQSTQSSFSYSSSSSYIDNCILSIDTDCTLQRKAHIRRAHRQKPKGPRPLPPIPARTIRPTLVIDVRTTSYHDYEPPIPPLPLTQFPLLAPTACTTPAPHLPSPMCFSPSDMLDWDRIYEVLECVDR